MYLACGAIQVAVVDTKLDADFNNQVTVGNNAKLASLGYLNLGTTTGKSPAPSQGVQDAHSASQRSATESHQRGHS